MTTSDAYLRLPRRHRAAGRIPHGDNAHVIARRDELAGRELSATTIPDGCRPSPESGVCAGHKRDVPLVFGNVDCQGGMWEPSVNDQPHTRAEADPS